MVPNDLFLLWVVDVVGPMILEESVLARAGAKPENTETAPVEQFRCC
jgi:hypothetical protein